MNSRAIRLAAAAVVAALLGVAAAQAVDGSPDRAERRPLAQPASAAVTSLPGLRPAHGEPSLPGLASRHPDPGTVVTVPGPFDDRFRLEGLDLTHRSVSGSITVTSDVSELLELQVLAGFYDDRGRLIGRGRFVHHLDATHEDEGHPHEKLDFVVDVPAHLRSRVSAVALGVPVLVNE